MFKDDAKSCDEYITQPENTKYNEPGFIGNFTPKDINFRFYKYGDTKSGPYLPYYIFLHISVDYNTFNFTFNDSAQESAHLRMFAYDSGKFFHKIDLVYIF